MTNAQSTEFNAKYCELSERDKDFFKDTIIRFMKVNFILKRVNAESYLFIISHKDLFPLFFEYLNFEFILREDKELAYIKSNDDKLSKNFTKNETLCLLILRLLYQGKMDEISLSDDIEITVGELQNALFASGFEVSSNDRVKKNTLNETLKTFKKHNIVAYNTDELGLDNSTILIYPSIEVAMDFKEMSEIVSRLDMLNGGEEIDEQIN